MLRKPRIRRTVLVAFLAIAVAAVVLAEVDASEESRGGAATAVAIVIGVYIRGQWQRAKEEDLQEPDGP